jgi:hypothetical protein
VVDNAVAGPNDAIPGEITMTSAKTMQAAILDRRAQSEMTFLRIVIALYLFV